MMLVKILAAEAGRRLATIDVSAPVKDAAELMSRSHIDLVVVRGPEGAMAGVVTKTDVVGQIRTCSGCNCVTRVDQVMTREVVSCRWSDSLQEVWSSMKKTGLQRIPVTDQGRPAGVVYARDALQRLLGEVEHEEALLRDYVMCVGYR